MLVDVRTPIEWETERASGIKKFIPYEQIEARHEELGVNKNTPVYLICRSGRRSGIAAQMLADLGYKRTYNVLGGTLAWSQAGLPSDSGSLSQAEN
jgi:rhodanese-related sulfurtransferase